MDLTGDSTFSSARPLVLVSNRGPVTFNTDGSFKRGTGGLVTALTGIASNRKLTWIASAMGEGDAKKAQQHSGGAFTVATDDNEFDVRLVISDGLAYHRFYSIFANPGLWFIQHYLWDQSNVPEIRKNETDAFHLGYKQVNQDLADAVLSEIDGVDKPVVMVHDYHLYLLPEMVRKQRPDAFLHHFVHIPWSQSDSWRVLPSDILSELFRGILGNDIIGFHTPSYRRNFLQCCEEFLDLPVDYEAGVVQFEGREVWARAYPLPIDAHAIKQHAQGPRVSEFESTLIKHRREHLIIRVDRADLSKNILRGFIAFDLFLSEHPEFLENVTFVAQLMPSRTDVPEYVEYLNKIVNYVSVINHKHGTPDWMPVQLKLRDDLDEAMAAYKHYDVHVVNAMFDGMNLVAKEGPIVNERAGVSILSENTGAHDELGEFALTVNPFDIQQLSDAYYEALTMSQDERQRRIEGLRECIYKRDPADWIDDKLADIQSKASASRAKL